MIDTSSTKDTLSLYWWWFWLFCSLKGMIWIITYILWTNQKGNRQCYSQYKSYITSSWIMMTILHRQSKCEQEFGFSYLKVLSTNWSRAKANRVLLRGCTGHSKHPLPTGQEMTLHMIPPDCQYQNQIDYILCRWRWRNSIQSAKTWLGADCGSDHELLIAKFRLKLKKVGETTRPFRYQFSSVTQSCPTLCDPMNCSMPGLPVHHQLPEFTQTHV